MKIDSHLKIFFFTNEIDQISYRDTSRLFKKIVEASELYMLPLQHLLGAKRINKFNDVLESELLSIPDNKTLKRIFNITIIVGVIFFSIFGIIIKSTIWLIDYRYRKAYNQFILERFKRQYDFAAKCSQRHVIKHREFKFANSQEDSRFVNLTKDLQERLVLPFLTNNDAAALARTCRLNHNLIINDPNKHKKEAEGFPAILVNKLGAKQIASLPFLEIGGAFERIFTDLSTTFSNNNSGFIFTTTPIDSYSREDFFPKLSQYKKNNIFQCRFPTGPGVILKIRDNTTQIESLLLISKHNNKWTVVCDDLSLFDLSQVLCEMRNSEQSPLINNYFERLLSGKPCGKFPSNINMPQLTNDPFPLEELNEGPLLCADGVTPVIQLAPV